MTSIYCEDSYERKRERERRRKGRKKGRKGGREEGIPNTRVLTLWLCLMSTQENRLDGEVGSGGNRPLEKNRNISTSWPWRDEFDAGSGLKADLGLCTLWVDEYSFTYVITF